MAMAGVIEAKLTVAFNREVEALERKEVLSFRAEKGKVLAALLW